MKVPYRWQKHSWSTVSNHQQTCRHLMPCVSLHLTPVPSIWSLRRPLVRQQMQEIISSEVFTNCNSGSKVPIQRCLFDFECGVLWFCKKKMFIGPQYCNFKIRRTARSLHVRQVCKEEWVSLPGSWYSLLQVLQMQGR